MLKTPCTAAMQNMVTPKCLLLYNSGRKIVFKRHNGPIIKIICNMMRARVAVLRIIKVSSVASGLKTNVSVTNNNK
jgi:hypothetical protein